MLRQAQQLQAKLAKMEEDLENEVVSGTAGGGVVKASVTGKLKVKSIEISPEAVDPKDVEMLNDLVLAAINDALDKAQELAQSRMSAITGGMNIPGLM
jgi:DNA-binding YbaB/EbfC family protein